MEFEKEKVCDVYNQIADRFNKTRGYGWSWIKEFMQTVPKGSTIYDIGCGSGRNMLYPDINFIGVDNCENLLKICSQKGLNVVYGDMCNLPLKDNSADFIISIAAFHHLSNVERRNKAIEEFYRVLKPGGKLLISVWSKNQPKKTRRVFENFGDVMVKWDQHGEIYYRYYYIFQINEIINLFSNKLFAIENHKWDCGNEIFTLLKQ
tara:strand:+ start:524 stop:1141 length:618 start_codon:yes stop_codon:yes gene_type:complete